MDVDWTIASGGMVDLPHRISSTAATEIAVVSSTVEQAGGSRHSQDDDGTEPEDQLIAEMARRMIENFHAGSDGVAECRDG